MISRQYLMRPCSGKVKFIDGAQKWTLTLNTPTTRRSPNKESAPTPVVRKLFPFLLAFFLQLKNNERCIEDFLRCLFSWNRVAFPLSFMPPRAVITLSKGARVAYQRYMHGFTNWDRILLYSLSILISLYCFGKCNQMRGLESGGSLGADWFIKARIQMLSWKNLPRSGNSINFFSFFDFALN